MVVGETLQNGLEPAGATRDLVVVLHEAHDLGAGVRDGAIHRSDLVQVIGTHEEVIRTVEIGEPLLEGPIDGSIIRDDQLVRTERTESVQELVDVCDAIEGMDDERQPRTIDVALHRLATTRFARLDQLDDVGIDGVRRVGCTGSVGGQSGTGGHRLDVWVFVCGRCGAFKRTVRARLEPLCTR